MPNSQLFTNRKFGRNLCIWLKIILCLMTTLYYVYYSSISYFFAFGSLFANLYSNFFSSPSRSNAVKVSVWETLKTMVPANAGQLLILSLFYCFLLANLLGNIPIAYIPTMFYSSTLTISLLFWVPLIVCVRVSQFKEFMAHLLPYGSPAALMIFLPIVELFSQLIRPFTLMIRISTNLSAGHIMMYMFSYFTLSSDLLAPFIYVVLWALFFLELAISMLQAYIFTSLVALYINETV